MNEVIKNLKKIGILSTAVLVFVFGCSDDFLIDENTQGLNSDVVFGSDATATAAVTGVYDGLQGGQRGDTGVENEYNSKGIFAMANYMGLDWQTQGPLKNDDGTFAKQFDLYEVRPDNAIAEKIWPIHYKAIGRANNVLFNLRPAVAEERISTDLGNRLIGEVLVLRAISYQYLSAVYGDVPLMLNISDDPFKGRDPQDTIFEQIVTDMNEAIPTLPWSYDNEKGRVSKGTAYAVLGNALMWLKRYEEAVTAFEAIEEGGVTSLEENYINIHALGNPNGKESLFEIQWAANGDLSWGRNDEVTLLPVISMPAEIGPGGGAFEGIPRKELYDSFEDGDLRKLATVVGPGDEHPDPIINLEDYERVDINTVGTIAEPWVDNQPTRLTGYYGVKTWRDPSINGWGGSVLFGAQNSIWIRYGEVLLSLAESALRSGQNGKAQVAFDRIRNRAWGGTAPAKTVTIDNILDEYRYELSGEFSLWPVIRRSGEAASYLQRIWPDRGAVPASYELVPIPTSQITANPNLGK